MIGRSLKHEVDERCNLSGLDVAKGVGQQVGDVSLQENDIVHARIGNLSGIEQGSLDGSALDKRDELGKKHTLHLETRLVVGVSEDKEDVAEKGKKVLLVELVGDLGSGSGKVVNNLISNYK